jgi:multidrug transporter EmrE-like cation transporter
VNSTPLQSVGMFVVASVLGATGSYLYKSGADAANGTMAGYLLSPRILSGVGCYGAVMVLFVAAYRRGGALSVLYPVYASTFIFGALIARWAYGTPIRFPNVVGMMLLVLGMYLMGRQ